MTGALHVLCLQLSPPLPSSLAPDSPGENGRYNGERLLCLGYGKDIWPVEKSCTRSLQQFFFGALAPCGLQGCKNRPAPFPGLMSYKATKPGLVSVLYLSMRYIVLLFIRAPFYVSLVFVGMYSVFWLFWLSYHYLPSDWLERLL